MIMRFTLFLLLIIAIQPLSIAQLPEDCVDAVNLVNTSVALSDIDTITIDSLISTGNDLSELELIDVTTCGPTGYSSTADDKSYWFGFSATNSGNLEFMIFPEDLNTDYDFALWKGSCPSNPCSEPIFCSWQPSLCGSGIAIEYTPTGVAQDPLATFGVDPTVYLSLEIYQETIQLEEGENYFLLIENRNELLQCGVEDSLGFTILFDGSATVGPILPEPIARVNFPLETDLKRCVNTSVEFSVTDIPDAEYQWTLPDNSIINGESSRFINLGTASGQLCVEILCPIQNQFCWDIEVGESPLLVPTNPTPQPCISLTVEDYVNDENNTSGNYALFESQIDALSLSNELPKERINDKGTYWIRKITDLCNSDPVEITSNPILPNLEAPSGIGTCILPYGLDNLPITETNGFAANNDLALLYYGREEDAINEVNAITEINSYGRVWVRGITADDCQDTISIEITSNPILPNLEASARQGTCELPYILDNLSINETNGFAANNDLTLLYYASEEDAINEVNEITESNSYRRIWVRGVSAAECQDTISIEIFNSAPTFQPIQPIQECDQVDVFSFRPVLMDGTPADFENIFDSRTAAEEGSSPLTSTIITESQTVWGRVDLGAGCLGFVPIEVTINKTTINPIDTTFFCNGSYDLTDLPLTGADAYQYYALEEHAQDQMFEFEEVITSTTVWVRGESTGTGCSDIISVELVADDPDLGPDQTINECISYDLSAVTLPVDGLTLSYHDRLADAETGANQFDGLITTDGTYYIRGATTGSDVCEDIVAIEIRLKSPTFNIPGPQRLENGQYNLENILPRITDLDSGSSISAVTYYKDSLEAANNTAAVPSIVTEVATYWIKGDLNGCTVIFPIGVEAESMSTLFFSDLPIYNLPCSGDCIDLAQEVTAEEVSASSPNLTIQFFETSEEAEDGFLEDALSDLLFCSPAIVWVRGTDTNGEYGVIPAQIGEIESITGTLTTNNQSICKENVDQLSLKFQMAGTAPFTITYSDGIRDFTEISSADTLVVDVNPVNTTTYSLRSVTDANGCQGVAGGEATITLLEQIAISNLVETCDDLQTTYTISFDIQSGDLPSLTVDLSSQTGESIAGTILGNRYFSDPIPVEDNYFLSISDKNACKKFEDNSSVICQCFTEAATLDKTPLNVCVDKTLRANKTEIGEPSMTDREFYVLHDSNTDQLGEIFTTQENTDFSYNDLVDQGINLELGTTYYLSSVFTKVDDQGEPILDPTRNPCIGIARGIPVKFFAIPEVTITLDKDTACIDDEVKLLFETNAESPFNVNVLGADLMEFNNIENGDSESIQAFPTDFIVEYIEIAGVEGCIEDSRSDSVTLNIFEPIGFEDLEMTCAEGGREFTISFTIMGGDPSSYIVTGSEEGTITGTTFTSNPIMHKSNYRFDITDGNNCEPVTIQDFGECPCTSDITTTISQLLEVTCPEDNDAAVEVTAQNGLPPYSFQWQDGSTSQRLLNLEKGMVYVSMTDANDCVVTDSFFVEGPEAIVPDAIINPPLCFGDDNASFIIRKVNGGTKPFEFYFNTSTSSNSQLYGNLVAQDYPFRIVDANGCEYRDTVEILDPDPLTVSLLNNPKKLNLGDSIEIDTRISDETAAFTWTSNTPLSCTDCTFPTTKPTETGIYSITVTNEFGCTASDELVIQILNDKSFYAPTVFSPNGDGINDTFGIFGGSQVSNINSLQVFNRWGSMLYNRTNLGQQVPFEQGWDGLETNGNKAPSGIYVFIAEIVYSDGSVEVVTGDVALMR